MRDEILSEREREVLKEYLKSGVKPEGSFFRVLAYRIRKSYKRLVSDVELIRQYLDTEKA